MGKGELSELQCLVLNRSFLPFDIINWQKAITLEFLGRCITLEHHPHKKIRSARKEWSVPIVIKVNSIKSTLVTGIPTRMMIYYRDNFRCAYCGKMLRDNELTIDHIIPKSKGGQWKWENLVTCCRECNAQKKEEIWVPRFTTPAKPKFLFPKYIKAQRNVESLILEIWKTYIPPITIRLIAER